MSVNIELPSTRRLSLRRFTPDDREMHFALASDPDVTRFTGGVRTREQADEMFQTRILAYYDQNPGLGAWATIERSTGDCIGFHLLNHMHGETLIQVGYSLFKRYWGKGYATEMTIALLRYGFTHIGLPTIHAITDLPHVASQHVLLKSGLHRNGERSFAHPRYEGIVFAWFERDASSWLAEHRDREQDLALSS